MNTAAATLTATLDRNIARFTSAERITAPKVQTGYRNVAKVLPEGTRRADITALFTAYLMTQDRKPGAEAEYVALVNRTLGTELVAEDFDSLTV